MIDLTLLKSELALDPQILGYTGSDAEDAARLNAPRPGVTFWRGVIPAHEIVSATDPADWGELTAAERQRYQTLTGAGQVDVSQPNVRAAFAAMFDIAAARRIV